MILDGNLWLLTHFYEGVAHVLPIDDAIEHQDSPTCWCQPTARKVWGKVLMIHHSADGREAHEPGSLYPPATRH